MKDTKWVLAFDSDCFFCSRFIVVLSFIDIFDRLYFCPLTDALRHKQIGMDSVLFFKYKQLETMYVEAAALRKLCIHLPLLWVFLPILYCFPLPILNVLYRYIAKNRYRLFGRNRHCNVYQKKTVFRRMLKTDECI